MNQPVEKPLSPVQLRRSVVGPERDHRIIVGDTIFEGGPGKTWSAAGFARTLQTLGTVVLAWPDETICYPGHGPDFRLGDRRALIETFLAKDHCAFFGDATWRMSFSGP